MSIGGFDIVGGDYVSTAWRLEVLGVAYHALLKKHTSEQRRSPDNAGAGCAGPCGGWHVEFFAIDLVSQSLWQTMEAGHRDGALPEDRAVAGARAILDAATQHFAENMGEPKAPIRVVQIDVKSSDTLGGVVQRLEALFPHAETFETDGNGRIKGEPKVLKQRRGKRR